MNYKVTIKVKLMSCSLHPVILLCQLHILPRIIGPIHSWFHLSSSRSIQPGCSLAYRTDHRTMRTLPSLYTKVYFFCTKRQWKCTCPSPPLYIWQIQLGFKTMIFWSLVRHLNQFCHSDYNYCPHPKKGGLWNQFHPTRLSCLPSLMIPQKTLMNFFLSEPSFQNVDIVCNTRHITHFNRPDGYIRLTWLKLLLWWGQHESLLW